MQAIAANAAHAGAGPGVGPGAAPLGGSNPSTILHGSSGGFGGSASSSGGGGGYGGGYGGAFAGPTPNAGANSDGSSGSVPNLFSRFGDSGAAFASGSVGPDGVQQSAVVYPENPVSFFLNWFTYARLLYFHCQKEDEM